MTSEERNRLIAQYAAGSREVQAALDGFPPAALTAHPFSGKWSAREIVHHLADSESGLYTATTWLQIYAVHAHNHAAQIARLKAALTK